MCALDCTIHMGNAAVVAGGVHPVVSAKQAVAFGHVLRILPAGIRKQRRQAVGPVLLRNLAQEPERSLQALGQGREALAAENHLRMFEPGSGKPEVIQLLPQLAGRWPALDQHRKEGTPHQFRERKGTHVKVDLTVKCFQIRRQVRQILHRACSTPEVVNIGCRYGGQSSMPVDIQPRKPF